jgi:pimeloyl-ACP methyl ester carboxylesterase
VPSIKTICTEGFGNPKDPCILLIMGLGMQMTAWPLGFCEQLVEHGFYVVRFDNRDVGLSEAFESAGRPNLPWAILKRQLGLPGKPIYSLEDMALDSIAVLDRLHIESAHIVGISMGGMIGQLIALNHRERVKSLVSIMSTTGAKQLPGPTLAARAALLAPLPKAASPHTEEGVGLLVEQSVKTLAVIGSPQYPVRNGPDQEALRDRLRASIARSYRPTGVARQLHAIIAAPDRTRQLKQLDCPTLVIHGEDDPLIPVACGQATARAIPNAELFTIEGMGHDLPEALWQTLTTKIAEFAKQHQP